MEEAIKKVQGVADTKNGVIVSGPALTFNIDKQRASRFGVTATDVANTITTAMSGDAASSILQQDRLITVRVILPPGVRKSLETVRALQVRSTSGALFRLDQVADIEYDKGQTEIEREGLRETVAVSGRLEGKDLGTAIAEIQTLLSREVKLPPGMTIEYGGLYQEQQSSFAELALSLVLAIVLVFLTLLIEFRSFAHPISIVTGAVLALGGVLCGGWVLNPPVVGHIDHQRVVRQLAAVEKIQQLAARVSGMHVTADDVAERISGTLLQRREQPVNVVVNPDRFAHARILHPLRQ